MGLFCKQHDNQTTGPKFSGQVASSHNCLNCRDWHHPNLLCCLQAGVAQLLQSLPVHVGYMSTEEWVLPLSW